MKKLIAVFVIIGLFAIHSLAQASEKQETNVLLKADVEWTPLNPARGDKSPQAGTLWGDRTNQGATGFLVKFKDGFSSPPHIHNITYRGVVISGKIHNDDPSATPMWMPEGSFWTQPAGEVHITAAQGEENIAYIEIDSGPYLVERENEAFDNGEHPVNVDPSNIVWLNADDTTWIDHETIDIAFLWESAEKSGTLIKMPTGARAKLLSNGSEFRGVVISGALDYQGVTLEPGSYFGASVPSEYAVKSSADDATILYVRSDNPYKITHDGGAKPHE